MCKSSTHILIVLQLIDEVMGLSSPPPKSQTECQKRKLKQMQQHRKLTHAPMNTCLMMHNIIVISIFKVALY